MLGCVAMFIVAQDQPPVTWAAGETAGMVANYPDMESNDHAHSKYNPTPGEPDQHCRVPRGAATIVQ